MFKTETHLHVSEISPCSKLSAREMIELYAEAGYYTVFVSDHLKSTCLNKHPELSWQECVDKFFYGYDIARAAGEELGVNVLISAELTYDHSPNHYLLYGFDKSFFYDLPDLFTMPKEEFYRYAKSKGVTVVQAHPYRDGKNTPDSPDIIDAVEAYNSNPRHDNFTEDCFAYASANGLPVTGGSDAHRLEDVARGGVMTDVAITTVEQYVELLMAGKLEIIK